MFGGKLSRTFRGIMRDSRKAISCALVFLALAAYVGTAQTPDPSYNRSKDQQKYFAQLERLKKGGRAAYADENAREKTGDCPKAMTTLDMNMCFTREVEKTTSNYKAYTQAIRGVETLGEPNESDAAANRAQHSSSSKRVKKFDAVEAAWNEYYRAQCAAAYDAYAGGTIAPMMELTCKLQLMRDRMHELEGIYQFMH
jgi:uncharacterized protein YecT (DUF1311 family)